MLGSRGLLDLGLHASCHTQDGRGDPLFGLATWPGASDPGPFCELTPDPGPLLSAVCLAMQEGEQREVGEEEEDEEDVLMEEGATPASVLTNGTPNERPLTSTSTPATAEVSRQLTFAEPGYVWGSGWVRVARREGGGVKTFPKGREWRGRWWVVDGR